MLVLPDQTVVPDDLDVPVTAALDDPSLRRVVNVYQAEPLAVSPAPFEVVQQGPHEIALQRYPVRDRVEAGAQVPGEVRDPVGVLHGAVRAGQVVVGGTVLHDVERDRRGVPGAPGQRPAKGRRGGPPPPPPPPAPPRGAPPAPPPPP